MILVSIAILFICLLSGVPVCVSFLASALYFLIIGDYDPSFMLPYGVNKMGSSLLFAIPMFILAGGVISKGKIGDKLIDLVEGGVLGRVKGGLGAITIIACAMFGSITGSASATLTCIGSILIPRMKQAGYSRGYCGSIIASASILGMLIPPSGLMIIYAWLAGESVLATFLAIVAPGLLLTSLFMIINFILSRKNENIVTYSINENMLTPKEKKKKYIEAFPALLLPFVVLGGIYGGIMTPTEAAALSLAYSIFLGVFVYKGLNWTTLKETLYSSAGTAGSIMIMIFCVMMLSRVYIMEDLPGRVLQILNNISSNKYIILLMINIFMIIMGMLMDDTSAVMLCTPILVPIMREIGVDCVHFSAIVAVNLGLGNITPPCAPMLYLGGTVADAPIIETLNTTILLILFGWIPTLLITTYLPEFSLFLPNLILGK